ncbi:B-block-binding subunit of tfiiic protein [Rhizoctonia solani AG-3 Rhs1AP]|uniref:B-block-binding subunit of tfiiic protein n=1 Tax=Rhizoctonia solani AG-3 Rhs1AP TaxID=1086054 RepID=X8JIF4_9AGAM|nr:B-block-binding subunit of tfiiic protein [Rhizoctonia solani AG-3 Rhs1AP]
MDALTKFILRELAYEGDLGSDLSRLRDLITRHYATQNPDLEQNVDDKLCSFVWSLLATQDNVVIGLAPDEAAAVYFPPQSSASRKGKEKHEDNSSVSLEPLPPDEFNSTPLETLVDSYGSSLRIAVTPETCFECITGSHIRPPKLSGPVYAVLQLITRTRREGISVIDIGKQSGYDPKTCFYLVQTLVNLGHIHKIKVGGAAGNVCIHKDFYDDECEWTKAEKEVACDSKNNNSLRLASPAASDDGNETAGKEFSGTVQFDSIDNRHISNVGVVKSRLQRLLNTMPQGIHVYRNLLFAIGFDASTKQERRTFNHRIHELIKAGFIEKVWAPSATAKAGRVLCVRLVRDNEDGTPMEIAEPGAGEAAEDPTETGSLGENEEEDYEESDEELLARFEGLCATRSLAHQIISAVERTGPAGVTIADISKEINDFDPRSITGLIARFAGGVAPTHLADRGLVIMTETAGRERRQRVYTRAGYHSMHQREGFQDDPADNSALMLANAGGWAVFEEEEFTTDEAAREQWTTDFARAVLAESGEKMLKARGKKKRTNPLDANGKPIIGRPRKEWKANGSKAKDGNSDLPKKRGRPPKRKLEEVDGEGGKDDKPVAKKRGRPPKVKAAPVEPEPEAEQETEVRVASDEPQNKSSVGHVPVGRVPAEEIQTFPVEQVATQVDQSMASAETVQDDAVQLEVETSSRKRTRRSRRYKSSTPSEPPTPQPASPAKRSSARLKGRTIDSSISSAPLPPAKRARVEPPEEAVNHDRSNAVDNQAPESPTGPTLPFLAGLTRIDQPEVSQPIAQSSANQTVATSIVSAGGHPDVVQVESSQMQTAPRMGRPTNVSALRRQTEFMQVIENLGGVVNISISKPFNDEHQSLLEQLHAEGKAVSTTPGTGMDRRTFNTAISTLESRGLLKTKVVSTMTQAGTTRRATVAYLPNAPDHLVNECIQKFQASSYSGKGIPILNDFPSLEGTAVHPGPRGMTQVVTNNLPASARAPELPQDPLAIARYEQLSNSMTAAQYLGYIPGLLARARALHLQLISEVTSENPSQNVVSVEDWIISKTYLSDSLPVSTYCSVVKLGFTGPGLRQILDSEEGPRIRVREVPANIQMSLGLQSAAAKTRLFKTLSLLVDLGCMMPVKPQTPANSGGTVYVNDAPSAVEWNYLKLAKSIPIYRFADKDRNAPFCYNHVLHDLASATSFWEQLRIASDRSNYLEIPTGNEPQTNSDAKLTRLMKRNASWESGYIFSSPQIEYLEGLIDSKSGHTPLDDLQSMRFDNACFVTTASASVVSEYFTQRRAAIQEQIDRVRSEVQREADERRRLEEESRKALAAKAAKAKMDQETRWEAIVSKALDGRAPSHPQLQKALATLKSNFMVSSRSASNKTWEAKVRDAVRDAIGAKQFVIPPRPPVQPFKPAQEPNNDVTELILRQGHPVLQKDIAPKKTGRKSKKEVEVEAEAEVDEAQANSEKQGGDSRRRRFPWNADYDELARDAGAVIRVRCHGKRIDWSALEQVFPGVQRSCVRQRISSLESLPGASMYYQRLDIAWASVYQQHRGSEALPDPNPDSLKDFDLPAYIAFLRQHIDKVAIRAGGEATQADTQENSFALESIDQLYANYIVNEKLSGQIQKQPTTWDFCFDVAGEEPREREFLQHPFVLHEHVPGTYSSSDVFVAQASMKMVMSTPDSYYDSNHAAALLNHFAEATITAAVDGLKDSLDLKRVRLDKKEPGRKYRYSDMEITRLKGEFPNSMYPDATAVRDSLECLQVEEWMNIDLTDEDGEVAAYLQLMSSNLVDIDISTEVPRTGRRNIGWQSKKVDDENLETQISIRLKTKGMLTTPFQNAELTSQPGDVEQILDPNIAVSSHQTDEMDDDELPSEGLLMDAIDNAGREGLSMKQIMDIPNVNLLPTLAALTKANPPQAYALGYDQARIVSAQYLSDWAVEAASGNEEATQTESKFIFPRRWLDIYGNMLEDIWTMSIRAVTGAFMYRPCMNELALRARFQGLFDRQELNDILTQLLLSGKLKRTAKSPFPIGMSTVEEEMATYWSLSNSTNWF